MNNIANNAGLFLLQSAFDLYIFIVMLRIVLQWVSADYTNPLFQLAAKLTNPPLKPIRRIIPTLHGIDIAAIVLLLLLEILKLTVLIWLQIDAIPRMSGLAVLAFAELLNQLINLFFYTILGLAILSWFSPLMHSPLIDVLHRISDPLMRPIRRVLPPIAGFDLSPIPVLIILKLLAILIVQPLAQIGAALALGSL
jgi:YggT family protein